MDDIALKRRLSEVVEAVDGNGLFTDCGLGLDYCSENNPCLLYNEFRVIRGRIHEMLQCTTIEEFNGDLNLGITTLKK